MRYSIVWTSRDPCLLRKTYSWVPCHKSKCSRRSDGFFGLTILLLLSFLPLVEGHLTSTGNLPTHFWVGLSTGYSKKIVECSKTGGMPRPLASTIETELFTDFSTHGLQYRRGSAENNPNSCENHISRRGSST